MVGQFYNVLLTLPEILTKRNNYLTKSQISKKLKAKNMSKLGNFFLYEKGNVPWKLSNISQSVVLASLN